MSSQAQVSIDIERITGDISPLLFGGFAEHMGRCIYGGIYEPASPHADERGFRRDVLAALRDLNFTTIRYPGGNFVSNYNWLDGVGPKEQRPRLREYAWQAIETNQFGTDEFMQYCQELGAEPMLGMNFGTRGLQDAVTLYEYCNAPLGTRWADLRAANGHPEPYNVRYWCLGNEMDGPWQIGHMAAADYACKAREAAKMLKWSDSSLHLIACGSSSSKMKTFPEWDRIVLEETWELVNYISMHYYADNHADDLGSFLASTANFDNYLKTMAGLLHFVKSKLRSNHDVYLSWDEWNVWYHDMTLRGGWVEAPRLVEDVYNLADALVVAMWLNTFLRHCDVLKIACVAQIVNVLGPILTSTDSLVKQTIFYPFQLFRRYARGQSLSLLVKSPSYEANTYGETSLLDASASYDAATGQQAIFLVNRGTSEPLHVDVVWRGPAPKSIKSIFQISGTDSKASNTFAQPDTVVPRQIASVPIHDGCMTLELPPLSFTVAVAYGNDD
jgi:alpha-N-arabinofuranosidase